MGKKDRYGHLSPSKAHQEFEDLVARSFGEGTLRRMVPDPHPSRANVHDPATPVAWAAAAAARVAEGKPAGEVVAQLGDLGVFCVALGSASLLGSVPDHVRLSLYATLPEEVPGSWLASEMLIGGRDRLRELREELEDAQVNALRAWTVGMLPLVVDAFARQAPRLLRAWRQRFAAMVLDLMAVPAPA